MVQAQFWWMILLKVTSGRIRSHVFFCLLPCTETRQGSVNGVIVFSSSRSIDCNAFGLRVVTLRSRDLTAWAFVLAWAQNLTLTFRVQKIHDLMRLCERNTLAFEYCFNLLCSKVINEKHIWLIEIVHLTWQVNSWRKFFKLDTIRFVSSLATLAFSAEL